MPAVIAAPPISLPEYTRDGQAGPESLRRTEWLLTNGQGGYAMGTVTGTPTRRYHGLFIPSLHPPVQREVMLHSLAETVVVAPGTDHEVSYHLTPYQFNGGGPVPTSPHLVTFTRTPTSCTWLFRIGQGAEQIEIEKVLHLHREVQAAAISYSVRSAMDIVRLQLRPLLRMQDAHSLLHASNPDADFRADGSQRHVKVQRGWRTLDLACDAGWFDSAAQWWYNFAYEHEQDRGYDFTEDLWSPGTFNLQLRPATSGAIAVTAWMGQSPPQESPESSRARLSEIIRETCRDVPTAETPALAKLIAAADDFVVRRAGGESGGTSIIAGYPWFSDWGRDSMISISGLLLATRRFDEARSVLATFASHRKNGLIPNLFNDQTGEAEYNTADASLWFLHAACEYLAASQDTEGFESLLKPACLDIIDAYREGTEFDIRVDPVDGLVKAGSATTQLTWMDARRDGIVFTPRHGKPVELSALWYSGVTGVAAALKHTENSRAGQLEQTAKRTAQHFRVMFWNASRSCLHDVLEPGPNGTWRPNPHVRPNQVFAASLPRSALEINQQRAVVKAVRESLWTPQGVRTLEARDPAYKGRYRGPMRERDAAYHNGTAWPWLVGPLAEALMRSESFSPKSRADARSLLAPLVEQLDGPCLGQLFEVYDGDGTDADPARPGGCPAQAWSVAETLRVHLLSFAQS